MMEKEERSALTAAFCNIVREYVAKTKQEISEWANHEFRALTDLFDERIKQIPEVRHGKDGKDGKDADLSAIEKSLIPRIQAGIDGAFNRQIEALPKPKNGIDGKDAVVDYGLIKEYLSAQVQSAMAVLPKAEEPTPIDYGLIKEYICGELHRIEKPKNGEPGKPGMDAIVDYDAIYDNIRQFFQSSQVRSDIAEGVRIGISAIEIPKGEPGKPGESVHPDTVRLMVLEEIKKEIATIAIPKNGDKGDPGRDAIDVDIIEAQQGKNYPRGTFLADRGGVVRMIGENIWQTVWCGIDSLDIVQGDDMRSFTVKAVLTSGRVTEKTFSMPVVIDRGVYRAGTEYAMGDAVSQGGSGFVCIVERTTASPAANNRDWRLWIKAGRDGKDLMPKESKASEPVRLA